MTVNEEAEGIRIEPALRFVFKEKSKSVFSNVQNIEISSRMKISERKNKGKNKNGNQHKHFSGINGANRISEIESTLISCFISYR